MRFSRGRGRARAVQLLLLALVAGALVGVGDRPDASAAIAADFDAGNIISDSAFFDSGRMSDHQVQAFLDARGSGCVAGEQACLKNYTTTTGARAADAYCRGYTGGLVQSAAQIIAGVAGSCGINPQVLLVLLEKEQRLVTRTQPTSDAVHQGRRLRLSRHRRLQSRVRRAVQPALQRRSRSSRSTPTRRTTSATRPASGTRSSTTRTLACGTGNVFLANRATAGLYNYTPYQPNTAAMANLYGTGDACSAYGNRNFWRMFSDWFGNPQAGGGHLMRTPENGTVFVVSGSSKYVVPDMGMLSALAPLGPVGYVSQQYLDRRPTVRDDEPGDPGSGRDGVLLRRGDQAAVRVVRAGGRLRRFVRRRWCGWSSR